MVRTKERSMGEPTRVQRAKELFDSFALKKGNNWLSRKFLRFFYAELEKGYFTSKEVVKFVDAYASSGKSYPEYVKEILKKGKNLPKALKIKALKTLSVGDGILNESIVAKKIYPRRSVLIFKKDHWLVLLQDGVFSEQAATFVKKEKMELWKQANNALRIIFNKETPIALLPPTTEISQTEALQLQPEMKLRREGYKGRGAIKIVQGFIPLFKGVETMQKWGLTHLSIDINQIVVASEQPALFQLLPQDGMFILPSKLETSDPYFEKIRSLLFNRLQTSYRIDPRVTPLFERENLEKQWDELLQSIRSIPYVDLQTKLNNLKGTIQQIQNFQLAVAFFEALTGEAIETCLARPNPDGINKAHFKWEVLQKAVYNLSTLSTDAAAAIVDFLNNLMVRDPQFAITLTQGTAFLEKIRSDKV